MGDNLPLLWLILAAMAGVTAWVAIMMRPKAAILVVGTMIFFAAIAPTVTYQKVYVGQWLLSVQIRRSEFFLGCGILLLASFIGILGQLSPRRIAMQAWFLLAIGLSQGLMRMIHESPMDGLISVGFALATILPLMLILPSLLREREDWYILPRAVMIANLIYVGACVIQLVFYEPGKMTVISTNRFHGFSHTPVNVAVFMAVGAVVALWLFLYDPKYRYRMLWIGLFGIDCLLAVGSGSRTGILLAIIGITAILYRRIGRAILILPLGALFAWASLKLISIVGLELGFARSFTFDDTRTNSWLALIAEGMQSPLVGIGTGAHVETGTSASENSYLYGFAAFGVFMLALLLTYLLASMFHCLKLFRAGLRHPQWRSVIDLLLAFNAMYFAASMLDGSLLGRVEQMLVMMLIFSAMSSRLLQTAQYEEFDIEELDLEERVYDSDEEHPIAGVYDSA